MAEKQSSELFQQALNNAVKESIGQIILPSTTVIKASWEAVYQKLETEFNQIALN